MGHALAEDVRFAGTSRAQSRNYRAILHFPGPDIMTRSSDTRFGWVENKIHWHYVLPDNLPLYAPLLLHTPYVQLTCLLVLRRFFTLRHLTCRSRSGFKTRCRFIHQAELN